MQVSVIIPTYNRAETLPRAINSVINQTFDDIEILVIDDGSTDDTTKLVTELYPWIKYYKTENRGVSAARNTGIKTARGKYVALLDSDDEWDKNKISEQIRLLSCSRHPLCHTGEKWIRNGKFVNQMKKHKKSGGSIFERCLELCCISPSSTLIKKEVFDSIGYFDESLPACEDYDYWCRLCAHHEVEFIDKPLTIKHGGHEDQLSKKYWGMDRYRVQSLCKLLSTDTLPEIRVMQCKRALSKKVEIVHKGAMKHENHLLADEMSRIIQKFDLQGNT